MLLMKDSCELKGAAELQVPVRLSFGCGGMEIIKPTKHFAYQHFTENESHLRVTRRYILGQTWRDAMLGVSWLFLFRTEQDI